MELKTLESLCIEDQVVLLELLSKAAINMMQGETLSGDQIKKIEADLPDHLKGKFTEGLKEICLRKVNKS